MEQGELMRAVVEAYDWQRCLGNTLVTVPHGSLLVDPTRPDVWMANHVRAVTAESTEDIDAFFAAMETHYAHCAHRMASVTPFTPESFVARLALDDFQELSPTIQMVLTGELPRIDAPTLHYRVAKTDGDWDELYRLMRIDHDEGARTNRLAVPDTVTRGLVTEMRLKSGPSTTFIVELDGTPCAYGSAILAPNGLGMVEDLFTLPSHRRRGIASALIRMCMERLRRDDRRRIFIGAHMREQPKHLYRRLGFIPLMLTREFLKDVALTPVAEEGVR